MNYRKLLDTQISAKNAVDIVWDTDRKDVIRYENDLSDCEDARKILQKSAKLVQQQIHEELASLVTRCLSTIFEDPYDFKIQFEQKRGKTEACLTFVRDNVTLTDPLNEAGGGAVDVASFALRLVCLTLQTPRLRKVLVLDEPFKNIRGQKYRKRVKNLLETLAKEFGLQFILNVDHESYPQFALGHVVDMGE